MRLLAGLLLAAGAFAQMPGDIYSACLMNASPNTPIAPTGNWNESSHPLVQVMPGKVTTCSAWGYYVDTIEDNGWSYLTIESNENHDNTVQAYAAGWLEGALTQQRAYQSYIANVYATFGNASAPPALNQWLDSNNQWMLSQISTYPSTPFWSHVSYAMLQLEGLVGGYNSQVSDPTQFLTYYQVAYFSVIGGDGINLLPAIQPETRITLQDYLHMSERDVLKHVLPNSHCSSLIRFTDDSDELFLGHTTWSSYCTLMRTFKTYALHYTTSASPTIQFSSYPSVLVLNSLDLDLT